MTGDGMAIRREVLGDAHVDRAVARTTAFTADFQDLLTRYAWGEIWSRPGLDRRTRSCITVAMLAVLRQDAELAMHVRAALRTDGRLFALRPRVLDLGYAYLSSLTLPEVAAPHLEQLVATVHESSSVSVLDGDEVVYVARVPTKRIMTVAISVGTRFPAHATSMGRVLLAGQDDDWLDRYLATVRLVALTRNTITDPKRLRAELRRIRAQGWALVDQELEEGLRSIAAPIRDADGRVVAAVNLSSQSSRSLAAMRGELLPHLLATAARIEDDLHRGAGR